MTPQLFGVLCDVDKSGPMRAVQLVDHADVAGKLTKLCQLGLVESWKEEHSTFNLYQVTPKGKRTIHALVTPMGELPAPRSRPFRCYVPQNNSTHRHGAMDAYALPSRRGEALVPHARPISLASRVQDTKFR